jgi:hypothetical protein
MNIYSFFTFFLLYEISNCNYLRLWRVTMISLRFNQILIKLVQNRFNNYANRSLLKRNIYIYIYI